MDWGNTNVDFFKFLGESSTTKTFAYDPNDETTSSLDPMPEEFITLQKKWLLEFYDGVSELDDLTENMYFSLNPVLKLTMTYRDVDIVELFPFDTIEEAKQFFNEFDNKRCALVFLAIYTIRNKEKHEDLMDDFDEEEDIDDIDPSDID